LSDSLPVVDALYLVAILLGPLVQRIHSWRCGRR